MTSNTPRNECTPYTLNGSPHRIQHPISGLATGFHPTTNHTIANSKLSVYLFILISFTSFYFGLGLAMSAYELIMRSPYYFHLNFQGQSRFEGIKAFSI